MTEKFYVQPFNQILQSDKHQSVSIPMEKSILDLCGYFPAPERSLTVEEINEVIKTKK